MITSTIGLWLAAATGTGTRRGRIGGDGSSLGRLAAQCRCPVRLDDLQQLREDLGIAGDEVAGVQISGFPGKVRNETAGFGDDQGAGSHVPR